MKRFQTILCASLLTLVISSSAFAGDITGKAGKSGDITGKNAAGDITGKNAAGDITGKNITFGLADYILIVLAMMVR